MSCGGAEAQLHHRHPDLADLGASAPSSALLQASHNMARRTISSTKDMKPHLAIALASMKVLKHRYMCPLILWAFQSRKKQLQAIFGPRPSPLQATAVQRRAFGYSFFTKHRQSLFTCSRLSVTLAVRLICFRSASAVTHPLRQAACILSRRHALHGQLGEIAAKGAGFVRVIGKRGGSDGEFRYPDGVAFDLEGNLVVSDGGNHRIQVLRYIDGAHLRTIGKAGLGKGQFNYPSGIAFDGAGHIIVSEFGGHRVQVLCYSNGNHVRFIGEGFGLGSRELYHPKGIAVDGEGNIVVEDYCGVHVYRLSDGTYIRSIEGSIGNISGNISKSTNLALCGLAFDSEGNIAVAAKDCVRVLRYSDGHVIRSFSSKSRVFQFARVAFDAAGHIVVTDVKQHLIQVLRYSDGALIRTIGSFGNKDGQFNIPENVAIDSDGCIIVVDRGNHRVQVLH